MMENRWAALALIGTAVLFSLSLWFSASVIAPDLKESWGLTSFTEAWLSASVPTGFVIGALISAYFGLADRFNIRKLFALSALLGAMFNGLLIFVDQAIIGITLRILTGIILAGVYPTSVKLISQWFPKQRGIATGILIASLTLGSSFPHFISIFVAFIDSRLVILISSILAILAAMLIYGILKDAPIPSKKTPFSLGLMKKVVMNKPVMLANYGYFGHMWELYAMWTWLPSFLAASFLTYSPSSDPWLSMLVSFTSIGIAGGVGCVVGGIVADKIGRSSLTITAMSVSGLCAIGIGLTFGSNIWITVVLALIWGGAVIADSAQFSVGVSEFAEIEYVGTALTFQMCIGFLITIISINLVPIFQSIIGWEWVFTLLSIGPMLGIIAMVKFKDYETGLYTEDKGVAK
ncbi:MFS transporter [Bacillus piscicola]|uniref:MFS transporter n=1 Tax=Bacillus piscicola TaxID=1632684 RepID=UPI001F090F78|nr:MFS transporter [Bacillus piscicola]